MNMYIYPKYLEQASKPHWTVKLLRAFGVIQIAAATLLGLAFARPIAVQLNLGYAWSNDAVPLLQLLGGLLGLAAGIVSSVGTWALALVIDDLHAMRMHSQAWVAFETENPRFGK